MSICLLLIFSLVYLTEAEPPTCTRWHMISEGDYCYKIWTDNGLNQEKILALNPNLNCNAIQPGAKVCVSDTIEINCARSVKVGAGDFCYKIWTENGVSESELRRLNPNLNCDLLAVSQKICVEESLATNSSSNYTTDSSFVEELKCGETYKIQSGDYCHKIGEMFSLNISSMMELNPGLDCDKLLVGDELCISTDKCQLRYEVIIGDICYAIATKFKLSMEELTESNPQFNCDHLLVGQKLCVWSSELRDLMNTTCLERHTVEKGDSCWSISSRSRITLDEFQLLNPTESCLSLRIGSVMCTKSEGTQSCASFVSVKSTDSCESLAASMYMSIGSFLQQNPYIDCSRISTYSQVCEGYGYFQPFQCLTSIRVLSTSTTCSTISSSSSITIYRLKQLNPTIDCSNSLLLNYLVCTDSVGDSISAVEKLMSSIKAEVPTLITQYTKYQHNPNYENSMKMQNLLRTAILEPPVYKKLKQLYREDDEMRKILDSGNPISRQQSCEQMKNSKLSVEIRNCFCNNDELFLYCKMKASEEIIKELGAQTPTNKRRKRAICSLSLPLNGKSKIDKLVKPFKGCFGGGCSFPVGFAEVRLSADICIPTVQLIHNGIKFCNERGQQCEDIDGTNAAALSALASHSSGARLQMCVPGTGIIAGILKIGGVPCLTIAAADYNYFVGKLQVSAGLDLFLGKVKGGAIIKVHESLYPKMCDMEDFECKDYCLWKRENANNGVAYGFIKVSLFSFFMWDGMTLFEDTINAPRKAGCQKGKETSILWVNERTCEPRVLRRCNSGDDEMKFAEIEDDGGFSFKPRFNTLFYCEFVDQQNSQKIGFDVYRGKSKNKGKKNFYYAVRNDGVYFGTEKDKVDQLKGKWDRVCEDIKEEEGSQRIPEPTGISSVPSAACGKRIIAYYTGWGEREVTVNQLKKLTHVIFAFVATYADGTIRFGPVSEDDSGPEAVDKAKRRFLDLKMKAREANSGVKVMFAVGGWDNSQHFSSIAGDSNKRLTFINGIVEFLKEYGIDGVDVDWEYPVTGGAHEGVQADKGNYVILLREIRERLDSLQRELSRNTRYELSLASAAGEWTIRPGYDLKGILQYADFVNVMTYDYYGAWGSKWGAYTGPPAPLFYGSPKGFSGKLNADFTMKYYACRSGKPSQLNMGVPFYGRYWENVGSSISDDEMWRTADEVGGKFQGGYVAWRKIGNEWNLGAAKVHEKTRSPYIWDAGRRKFLGFESPNTLREKADYSKNKNLGGLMIWAIDLDDDADTLLNIVSSADLCSGGSGDNVKFECVPIDDVRWWTPENGGEEKQGMCGKYAPLIDGYYAVCDPDDPGYACCGKAGYCGSGAEFCSCEGCVDYRTNPKAILNEPIKPTKAITWHMKEGLRGKCGPDVEKVNGQMATCNGDDNTMPCCGSGGYCGSTDDYCKCDKCIDYRKK